MNTVNECGGSIIVEIKGNEEQIIGYTSFNGIRDDILNGKITRNQEARRVAYEKGEAKPGKWLTVWKLSKSDFKVRSLYEPVMAHIMKGMMIGFMIGCILKALDTTITFFVVDSMAGIIWLVFAGFTILGSVLKNNTLNMVAMGIGFLSIFLGMGNVFFTILAVMIVGFLGVAPLGMITGTIVGSIRKHKLSAAPDAEPEGSRIFLLGILLPLLWEISFFALYFYWLNPLIFNWLTSQA
jgi:hypothetical protein